MYRGKNKYSDYIFHLFENHSRNELSDFCSLSLTIIIIGLGSTQPLTEMSASNFPWEKRAAGA
jgi:hypothetical protein